MKNKLINAPVRDRQTRLTSYLRHISTSLPTSRGAIFCNYSQVQGSKKPCILS